MTSSSRHDPFMNYLFKFEITGLIIAGFSEISGLQSEMETHIVAEGGVNDMVHILPKRAKQQNIILKRGFTDSDVLWNWYQDILKGRIKRKNARIYLENFQGKNKWLWKISDVYPVKWIGPELYASGNTVAIEALELVHKGFTMEFILYES